MTLCKLSVVHASEWSFSVVVPRLTKSLTLPILNSNMKNYLVNAQGFREDELLILMDDGYHPAPTRENMISAFRRITEYSQPGDVVSLP